MRNIVELVEILKNKVNTGCIPQRVIDYAKNFPETKGYETYDRVLILYVAEGVILYTYGRVDYYLKPTV